MRRFEYSHETYYSSDNSEDYMSLGGDLNKIAEEYMNIRGSEGWEIISLNVENDEMIVWYKREIQE